VTSEIDGSIKRCCRLYLCVEYRCDIWEAWVVLGAVGKVPNEARQTL